MASPGCDLAPWFLCSWSRQSWVPWGLEVFASVQPLFSFWHCPSILPAAVPVFLPRVWCHCPVYGQLSWLLCPLQRVCVSIGSVPPVVGPAPPLTMVALALSPGLWMAARLELLFLRFCFPWRGNLSLRGEVAVFVCVTSL